LRDLSGGAGATHARRVLDSWARSTDHRAQWVDANDLEGLGLVDHHVHGVGTDEGRARWEAMLTESDRRQPTAFDSQVGLHQALVCTDP
jgi:hypothetical protein